MNLRFLEHCCRFRRASGRGLRRRSGRTITARPFIPLMMYLMRILSVDYLPQEVRDACGMKPLNRFDRAMKKIFVVQYRLTPGFVGSLSKAYYMKRGRVMVAKLKERGFTGDVRMRKN